MFVNAKSVEDWIRAGADYFDSQALFYGHGTDNAIDEAAVLVAWALGIEWHEIEANRNLQPNRMQTEKIASAFAKRVNERIPAAYITGETWFAGIKFSIDERALVPRSPLAELIQNQFHPWLLCEPKSILDLCCGSGCIGLACASYFPGAEVYLSDISEQALALAEENRNQLAKDMPITLVKSDGFKAIQGKFDLIVSNPPYVDERDFREMPQEYRAEPEIGLTSGQDGLEFTRHILQNAAEFLNEKGSLIVELGNTAETLQDKLPRVPFYWPEFEFGGQGVFVISREELIKHEKAFVNL